MVVAVIQNHISMVHASLVEYPKKKISRYCQMTMDFFLNDMNPEDLWFQQDGSAPPFAN